MLCYVTLCYVTLCYVILCYVMLYYVMLCYITLRYVTLCHVMLFYIMLCYTKIEINKIILTRIEFYSFVTQEKEPNKRYNGWSSKTKNNYLHLANQIICTSRKYNGTHCSMCCIVCSDIQVRYLTSEPAGSKVTDSF